MERRDENGRETPQPFLFPYFITENGPGSDEIVGNENKNGIYGLQK
jgi:hypothetical protein